jgi:predicted phosphodiesterase
LGDLHAEAERLAVALEVLSGRGVDRLGSVGDVCDGEGDLAATVALLEAHEVLTVRGNHDRWFSADQRRDPPFSHRVAHEPAEVVALVRALPPALELATVAGPALLGHGVGRDDMAAIDPETTDRVARWHRALGELLDEGRITWLLGGHTHRFMLRRFDHLGVVNAGALSRRDEAPGDRAACFVRIDFEARSVERWTFAPGTAEIAGVEQLALP